MYSFQGFKALEAQGLWKEARLSEMTLSQSSRAPY